MASPQSLTWHFRSWQPSLRYVYLSQIKPTGASLPLPTLPPLLGGSLQTMDSRRTVHLAENITGPVKHVAGGI